MNNKSYKMYQSIISESQDDAVDRSKYVRVDLDSLKFNDVPLSTEDSLVDIIPFDWDDTGSDNRE